MLRILPFAVWEGYIYNSFSRWGCHRHHPSLRKNCTYLTERHGSGWVFSA